ncbi:hypothetical protein [Leucobacter sp. 1207-22]|uniref:hypothetical protein n=1 Tax=Leucobacter sp. 1207-22 TaxID=2604456 RepID=UPI004062DE08
MKNAVVTTIGLVLAAWMSLSHWAFGIGGPLTWWYLPCIGLTYAALQLWFVQRLRVTEAKGKRTSRSTIVALILSWVSAIGFGLTVPNEVAGELVSIVSPASGGGLSIGMSIALCNPLGIIAFTIAGIAIGFAFTDSRDKRTEDEEYYPGEGEMPKHPLA